MEKAYEDEHFAVVIKPSGVATHDKGSRSVKKALAYNLTPTSEAGALARPQNVHRLDKPTGVRRSYATKP